MNKLTSSLNELYDILMERYRRKNTSTDFVPISILLCESINGGRSFYVSCPFVVTKDNFVVCEYNNRKFVAVILEIYNPDDISLKKSELQQCYGYGSWFKSPEEQFSDKLLAELYRVQEQETLAKAQAVGINDEILNQVK